VLVLGDSYTEALQVGDGQTYCAKLEARLTRRLGREVWVGNAARSGREAADYLYYLPAYAQRFRPDLMVVAFTPGDFQLSAEGVLVGNTARFDPSAREADALSVHLPKMGPGGTVVAIQGLLNHPAPHGLREALPTTGALGVLRGLLHHSGLVTYSTHRVGALVRAGQGRYEEQTRKARIASVKELERYLACLRSSAGVPILVANLVPDHAFYSFPYRAQEERLGKAAKRLGIPFVSTARQFREHFTATGTPGNGFDWNVDGPGFGHLNPAGHALVAQALESPAAAVLMQEKQSR
jgi:hypothetical protein